MVSVLFELTAWILQPAKSNVGGSVERGRAQVLYRARRSGEGLARYLTGRTKFLNNYLSGE
ncbi:MAG TPA: hypothetical protein VNG90_01610 [Candidatus Acidoferrum sp.]|nr:hypothetical protein [Candidatus Acidoferrum sp.]